MVTVSPLSNADQPNADQPNPDQPNPVLIVDPQGHGDFLSIEAAMRNAGPHDYLLLRAGRYQESIDIHVPVTIVGDTQGVGQVEIEGSVVIHCLNPEDAIVIRHVKISMPNDFSVELPPLFSNQATGFLGSSSFLALSHHPDNEPFPHPTKRYQQSLMAHHLGGDLQNSPDSIPQGSALVISSGHVRLEHCVIQGGRGSGIQMWEATSKLVAYDCEILHSELGILVETGAQATIENCRIHHMERLGIGCGRGSSLRLVQSIVSQGIGAGLALEGCRSVEIESCQIFDWSRSGLVAKEILALQIVKTQVYRNTQNGIIICKRSQVYITQSRCEGNGWHNVVLLEQVNAELTNCHLSEALQSGIALYQDSRATLKRCHLEGNVNSGVLLLSSSTLNLEQCTVENHSGNAIEIKEQSHLILDKTRVIKNGIGQRKAAILNQSEGRLSIRKSIIQRNHAAIERTSNSPTLIRYSNLSGNKVGVWVNPSAGSAKNLSLFMVYQGLSFQLRPHLSAKVMARILVGVMAIGWGSYSVRSYFVLQATSRQAEIDRLKLQTEQQEIDRQRQSITQLELDQANRRELQKLQQEKQLEIETLQRKVQEAEAEIKAKTNTVTVPIPREPSSPDAAPETSQSSRLPDPITPPSQSHSLRMPPAPTPNSTRSAPIVVEVPREEPKPPAPRIQLSPKPAQNPETEVDPEPPQ